jgi:flagella basal body P-ring formation protein FlgA
MRIGLVCVAIVAWLPCCLNAQEAAPAVLRVVPGQLQSLQDGLLALAQRLLPDGLIINERHAWTSVSAPLPATDTFEVRPAWTVADAMPPLPLKFELRPVAGRTTAPIYASLAVRLEQRVLVAARRLHKGSTVARTDFTTEPRDVAQLPRRPLSPTYEIASELVALRDIAAGDVVRSSDIGPAPAVAAGLPVRVFASTGAITVSTTATALADADVGDRVDVRLQHPLRTLKARVIGPGAVQPVEGSHE